MIPTGWEKVPGTDWSTPVYSMVPWLRVLMRHWGGARAVRQRCGWTEGREWRRVLRLKDPLQDPEARLAISRASGFDSRRWTDAFREEAGVMENHRRDKRACYAKNRPDPNTEYEVIARMRADAEVTPKRWR